MAQGAAGSVAHSLINSCVNSSFVNNIILLRNNDVIKTKKQADLSGNKTM